MALAHAIGDKVDESFGLPTQWNEVAKNPSPRFPGDGMSYEAVDPWKQAVIPLADLQGRVEHSLQAGPAAPVDLQTGHRLRKSGVQRRDPVR